MNPMYIPLVFILGTVEIEPNTKYFSWEIRSLCNCFQFYFLNFAWIISNEIRYFGDHWSIPVYINTHTHTHLLGNQPDWMRCQLSATSKVIIVNISICVDFEIRRINLFVPDFQWVQSMRHGLSSQFNYRKAIWWISNEQDGRSYYCYCYYCSYLLVVRLLSLSMIARRIQCGISFRCHQT